MPNSFGALESKEMEMFSARKCFTIIYDYSSEIGVCGCVRDFDFLILSDAPFVSDERIKMRATKTSSP